MKAAPSESPSPGSVIRTARERADLTREELARESGVSTSTVARLELTNRLPNTLALVRIAARVGVNPADLLPAAETAAAAS